MTQEQKELLLRDLCARVPYGVKYMRYSWNYDTDQELPVIETLECVDKDGYINHRRVYTVDDIKPYLFPLSSMTEEQHKEFYDKYCWNDGGDNFEMDSCSHYYALEKFDWLNKNHFDIYDLIPMGLAIDATGKNVY